jgi:5'-3' exonuclease
MGFEKYSGCRLIVDLNHLAFRNWSANGTLANSSGELTGAIYGTIKSLLMLIENFSPVSVIAAKDLPGCFRQTLYPAYKANRLDENRTVEEIAARKAFDRQLNSLETILEALGIPVLSAPGLEADDMAALVTHIPFEGMTVVVSGDRDYIQLVRPGIALFSPMLPAKGKLLLFDGPEYEGDDKDAWAKLLEVGPRTFTRWVEKLPRGVPLDRWLLYRALVGDSSDNLPGVRGIGPAAALKVVEHFCSFSVLKEAILGNLDYTNVNFKGVLNKGQLTNLEVAFATGDLETQYEIIDLSTLVRLEGSDELLEAISRKISRTRTDEDLVRQNFIHWQFTSFLVGWKSFLKKFPAFQGEPLVQVLV